ncbi:MAG TPA: hypothetical protein VE482_00630 [Candidatus Eisenbacteria bacterium]|nr:hypothetical protein [Candidatus Eisenbacteria bacterium]
MPRALTPVLLVAMFSLWGCGSSAPPPRPAARPFDDVRRVVVVVSGDSAFSIEEHALEPGRTFDEVIKWIPSVSYQAMLRPAAQLIHRGINWALEADRAALAASSLQGVSPRSVVADSLARTLEASGWFTDVRTFDREPSGEDRRSADAIVRVWVLAWGLVRVREGEPALLSSFADVRGQMAMRGTGVVLWEYREDVTNAEQIPVDAFLGDREFARQEMIDVLERAGQRLANEILYSRSAGR